MRINIGDWIVKTGNVYPQGKCNCAVLNNTGHNNKIGFGVWEEKDETQCDDQMDSRFHRECGGQRNYHGVRISRHKIFF